MEWCSERNPSHKPMPGSTLWYFLSSRVTWHPRSSCRVNHREWRPRTSSWPAEPGAVFTVHDAGWFSTHCFSNHSTQFALDCNPLQMMGQMRAGNPEQAPEERFASQLDQLASMGFVDRQANIQGGGNSLHALQDIHFSII